jgi:hypothetical protein
MAVLVVRQVDDTERRFLLVLAAISLIASVVAGIWLAVALGAQESRLSADYWKYVLTALGLSTLALAGITVQLPRYSGGTKWSRVAIVAVTVAFVLILLVVAVSLREVAIPEGETSPTGFGSILVASLGVTLTLAGVVVSGAATILDKIDVTA